MAIPEDALALAAVAIHNADCSDTHCSGSALGHCCKLARAALEAAAPHSAAEAEFLAASVTVWREIDRLDAEPDGYHPVRMSVELRQRERAAWERYRDTLAEEKSPAPPSELLAPVALNAAAPAIRDQAAAAERERVRQLALAEASRPGRHRLARSALRAFADLLEARDA